MRNKCAIGKKVTIIRNKVAIVRNSFTCMKFTTMRNKVTIVRKSSMRVIIMMEQCNNNVKWSCKCESRKCVKKLWKTKSQLWEAKTKHWENRVAIVRKPQLRKQQQSWETKLQMGEINSHLPFHFFFSEVELWCGCSCWCTVCLSFN